MAMLTDLASVQAYRNDAVVALFSNERPEISEENALQIFADLLSWLWLSDRRSQRQLTTHMITPLAHLDQMWHCFLAHPTAYADFCQVYFDRYIPHVVAPADDDYVMSAAELSEYLSDCYDLLGEAWIMRNFPMS